MECPHKCTIIILDHDTYVQLPIIYLTPYLKKFVIISIYDDVNMSISLSIISLSWYQVDNLIEVIAPYKHLKVLTTCSTLDTVLDVVDPQSFLIKLHINHFRYKILDYLMVAQPYLVNQIAIRKVTFYHKLFFFVDLP